MGKKGLFRGIFLLLFGVLLVGCCKENDNSENNLQEMMEDAENVMGVVSDVYTASETVEEMASYLDEIKAMENVEDAWQEENSIAAKIKDGGIIRWCFFPNDSINVINKSLFDEIIILDTKSTAVDLCENSNACISIAFPFDKSRFPVSSQDSIIAIKRRLMNRGYNISQAVGNNFDPLFISKLPNYGVNIIITHGGYDSQHGQHWIMTGKEYGHNGADTIQYYTKNFKRNRLSICNVKEVREGIGVIPVSYWAVSETYITEAIEQRFPRNSFMFVGACSTLKGSFSLWNFFEKKGLGCYFGYNGNVSPWRCDCEDLSKIMRYMLENGYTSKEAYTLVGHGSNPQLLLPPSTSNVVLWVPLFSISPTKRVRFASGNLADGGRNLCTFQWNYGGLFGWGTGANPGNTSTNCEDYPTFVDWGNYISGNWRTMTNNEWKYMVNSRPNAYSKRGLASVRGIHGMVLLPDNWVLPSGCSFTATSNGWNTNTYNANQWTKMETNGAVFLPAAGARKGTDIYNYGEVGCYWTSTRNGNDLSNASILLFYVGSIDVGPYGYPAYGYSVRLVQDM